MKKAVVLLFVFPASILFVFELKPSLQKEKHSFDKQDRRYPILLQEQWMGIYFKKKKLGFSYSALFQGKSGFRRTSRAVIQLTASDSLQKTSFNQETFLSKKKEIEAFNFSQEMSGHLQV
ncbi:MAG: hypothetical protein ACE5FU_13555, partial [Nitrospinota bacterium]